MKARGASRKIYYFIITGQGSKKITIWDLTFETYLEKSKSYRIHFTRVPTTLLYILCELKLILKNKKI